MPERDRVTDIVAGVSLIVVWGLMVGMLVVIGESLGRPRRKRVTYRRLYY